MIHQKPYCLLSVDEAKQTYTSKRMVLVELKQPHSEFAVGFGNETIKGRL